jgi:hypothetical protein
MKAYPLATPTPRPQLREAAAEADRALAEARLEARAAQANAERLERERADALDRLDATKARPFLNWAALPSPSCPQRLAFCGRPGQVAAFCVGGSTEHHAQNKTHLKQARLELQIQKLSGELSFSSRRLELAAADVAAKRDRVGALKAHIERKVRGRGNGCHQSGSAAADMRWRKRNEIPRGSKRSGA